MGDLRPIVYLVDIGMEGGDRLTSRAVDCLEATQVVMGMDRTLDSVSAYTDKKRVFSAYKPNEMVQWLGSSQWDEAALVLSGNMGFYSEAEAAAKAFLREGWDMGFVPGVFSLSHFCTRLGKGQQNVHPASNHGRSCDVVTCICSSKGCFILLGGVDSMPDLCRQLINSGMSSATLWIGEDSSYENECIAWQMTPAKLPMEDERLPFSSLACALVENTEAAEGQLYPQPGPQDEDYTREQVPMTKKEVRRVSPNKLCIDSWVVCYDIGAGTGSVAVEVGMEIHKWGGSDQVYAIERNREALQLIESNYQKFYGSWTGFHTMEDEAPETVEGLEPPTHAFIGGSEGHMRETVAALLDASPHMRIVTNAIILETAGETLAYMKEFGFATGETAQVWAVPVDTVGSYHMPKTQNLVYIAVVQDPKDGKGETQWQKL